MTLFSKRPPTLSTCDHAEAFAASISRKLVAGAAMILALGATSLNAQLYWDPNGGADWNTSTTGSASKYWNPDPVGANATRTNWVDGSLAVFSSGTTDYTGTYTINLGTAITATGITVEEGNITLSGSNTLTLSGTSPSINVMTGTSLAISAPLSVTSFTKTGAGTLTLGTSYNFSGTLGLNAGTLAIGSGATLTVGTLHITGNSVIDFSAGASILNVGTLIIDSGATLTINGWSNAIDYFYATNFTGATTDNRGGSKVSQIVFSGSSGSNTVWQGLDKQLTPVPESSAYGALFLGLSAAGFLLRRRSRRAA